LFTYSFGLLVNPTLQIKMPVDARRSVMTEANSSAIFYVRPFFMMFCLDEEQDFVVCNTWRWH